MGWNSRNGGRRWAWSARVTLGLAWFVALASACSSAGNVTGGETPANSCTDGKQSAGETDVDCGGPCSPCADGKGCMAAADCSSGACTANKCGAPPAPTCSDKSKNGKETDVDCGGGCPPCADGQACGGSGDCKSMICTNAKCLPAPTCMDKAKNGGETDVDCGGPMCPTCVNGMACTKAEDCASKYCDANGKCADVPPCNDVKQDGTETDVDCGGLTCDKCPDGKKCLVDGDCKNNICENKICVAAKSCANKVKDNDETDVDCGGAKCAGCAFKQACNVDSDCASLQCVNKQCACKLNEVLCGNQCVDLVSDKANCSKCANQCVQNYCQSAVCSDTCKAPSTVCNGACVHLDTPENCGACGVTCTASQVCSEGLCVDKAAIGDVGCADGQRDAFTDKATFPNIAGCAGAWTVPGVFPYSPRTSKVAACATNGDDKEAPGPGTDCSAGDLCAPGWHICKGGEIGPRTGGKNCAAMPAAEVATGFYTASISGPGCFVCAAINGAITDPVQCTSNSCKVGCHERDDLTNDLFGCGNSSVKNANCEANVSSGNVCNAVDTSVWKCPDDTKEGIVVTKIGSKNGGVLCCR